MRFLHPLPPPITQFSIVALYSEIQLLISMPGLPSGYFRVTVLLHVWEMLWWGGGARIFQYWQASKGSHVCGIVCTMSEFPIQTRCNKLITIRSKWLTRCSLSLKYLHVKRWEKSKMGTPCFYLWNPDMEKKAVKYIKQMQGNMKGLYCHCWESLELVRGPLNLLPEILRSFCTAL